MVHLLFIAVVIASAAVFALLEIQIEGEAGWATTLPTWRIENRFTRMLLGNRAITGYHVYFQLFILTITHLPYAVGLPFSWQAELRIIAFLLLFWVFEDFLWFVFNPAYGLRGFNQERAWWHGPNWWWIMPRDYWIFAPIGIALYLVSW